MFYPGSEILILPVLSYPETIHFYLFGLIFFIYTGLKNLFLAVK